MSASFVQTLRARAALGVEHLFPAYFALVMATGIVSMAALLRGLPALAWTLLVVNVLAYLVLMGFLFARLWRFPRRVLDDLRDHGRGPGFFTLVASTCVLGTQSLLIAGNARIAWLMFGLGVATQSVSILGTQLSVHAAEERDVLLFFTLCMHLLGAMLYLAIITLIFYRFTFLELTMERLTPPYWINMGAVAVATLAGSTLLLHTQPVPLFALLRPFLMGFTLFFWATATWWIPLLVILSASRR